MLKQLTATTALLLTANQALALDCYGQQTQTCYDSHGNRYVTIHNGNVSQTYGPGIDRAVTIRNGNTSQTWVQPMRPQQQPSYDLSGDSWRY